MEAHVIILLQELMESQGDGTWCDEAKIGLKLRALGLPAFDMAFINNLPSARYPQSTPKSRVIARLRDAVREGL